MRSWSTVRALLKRLEDAGIRPACEPLSEPPALDWSSLPPSTDPSAGGLPDLRARRKRRQIESMIAAASEFIHPGSVVVDFGASSGTLGLPLAATFPEAEVLLVDKRPRSVALARERIEASGLSNLSVRPGLASKLEQSFDLGVGLHLCGDATDRVQAMCVAQGAAYVITPCCNGNIRKSDLEFPRSEAFRAHLSREDFERIASIADWTCREPDGWRRRCGELCMSFANEDRNRAGQEQGYRTHHRRMRDAQATPKNQLLVGVRA